MSSGTPHSRALSRRSTLQCKCDLCSPDCRRTLALSRSLTWGHTGCIPFAEMNRREREITAPFEVTELQQLLNTMTPEQEQAITTRTRIADVQAALAAELATAAHGKAEAAAPIEPEIPRLFNGVDLDEFLTETVSKMVAPRPPRPMPPPIPRSSTDSSRPKRKHGRPFSQVAALLPPCEPTRTPRGARPAPWTRATTQTSLAVAEQKAPRTVAELRARMDSGETPAQWAASSGLSPRVLAHLSAEEIAMLPTEIRGALADALDRLAPPRIEIAPVPSAEVVDIQFAPVPAAKPPPPPTTPPKLQPKQKPKPKPQRFAAIIASLASMILVWICAVYFLI